jgi:hypothetical protein
MRVAVIGVCQVHALRDAFAQLLDDAEVTAFEAEPMFRLGEFDKLRRRIAACDYVFAQDLGERFGPLARADMISTGLKFTALPGLVFTGFHPDCTYMNVDGKAYASPVGMLHSPLIAAAFALAVPAERVERLFNAIVFRRLGYFDEFAKSRDFLFARADAAGFDLRQDFSAWLSAGAFMHTPTHPKALALASLARLAAVAVGLVPPDTATPHAADDFLAHGTVWPVYPPLADAIGVPGSYFFKKAGLTNTNQGRGQVLSLRDMIMQSYALYADFPPGFFDAEPIGRTRGLLAPLVAGRRAA